MYFDIHILTGIATARQLLQFETKQTKARKQDARTREGKVTGSMSPTEVCRSFVFHYSDFKRGLSPSTQSRPGQNRFGKTSPKHSQDAT